ncbi:MAG: TIGR02996 domain-containing protein [Myxococcaceae bacterium]|nr:TIGR02996 domain-containing protein [Myxococcaceae bacterium]
MSRGAALLEAVYRNPSDLQARRVYADWLLAQGDPRAEFIMLQLAAPTEAGKVRAAELFEQRGAGWVGGLAEVLDGVTVNDFEGGFLTRCWPKFTSHEQAAALASDAAWSTVREAVTSIATHELKAKDKRSKARRTSAYESALVPQFLARAPLNALERFARPMPVALAASLTSRATPFSSLRELTLDVTDAALQECRARCRRRPLFPRSSDSR